jgi:hypothetical protein
MDIEDWIKKPLALTTTIQREALELGIPLPKDGDWWDNDSDNYGGPIDQMEYMVQHWLTDIGVSGSRKLLQAERRRLEEQKRADVEWQRRATQWKLTVAGTIIGWIIAVLSLVTAIMPLRRK